MSQIRLLQSYNAQSDAQLVASAGAVLQGMTGNTIFAAPPVELKEVQAALADLLTAVAAQPQGGTGATAHKKNKRHELIALLRRLAHYVQDNSGGDVAAVLSAGFTIRTSTNTSSALEKPSIQSIEFGNATQLVVKVRPVPRARCYEVRYSAGGNGSASPSQNAGLFTNSRLMTVTGLTPGNCYAFQVRALGSSGYTDWSDALSHMCV